MINMYKEIDQTPYKQEINAKNLIQCWKECMDMSSYSLRKAAVEKFNSENYWKKKGLAVVPLKFPVGLGSVAAGQVSSPNDQSEGVGQLAIGFQCLFVKLPQSCPQSS